MNSKSIITWAPGTTGTVAPVYSDWNDIESVVNALQGNAKLCIDMTGLPGFAQVPATASLDGKGRLEIVGVGPNGEAELQIADGGQIKNVQTWRTIVVRAAPSAKPPVKYDIDGMVIDMFDATFIYSAVAAAALISVETPSYIAMFMVESALHNNHNPGKPVINLVGNVVALVSITSNSFQQSPTQFDGTIGGGTGSSLNLQLDGSLPSSISLPGFAGAVTQTQIESAQGIAFTANAADWISPPPSNVQTAMQRMVNLLKSLNGGNPIP